MFRKYVIITLAAFMFLGTSACTSKKAEDDTALAEAGGSDVDGLEISEATEDNSDLDTSSTADSGSKEAQASAPATDDAVADLGVDDLSPDEKLPEDKPAAEPATDVASTDLSETPPPAEPPPAESTDVAAADALPSDLGAPTPEPTAEPLPPTPDAGLAAAGSDMPSDPVAKPSLLKIKSAPYKQGKILVNAVYIARKGDTVEGISQKVFGTPSRVKEICKVNSFNCSRPTKVGDKFYYNSPQRPTDDTALKVFYEDAGLQPEIYTAKAGDNIRKVGKDLLGDSRSWMELWATNEVESKGDLDEGTQLKYWPQSEVAAPVMAQNDAAPPAEAAPAEVPPPAPPVEEVPPPPPPQDMAMNDQMAPPPPPPSGNDLPPPPPPPDQGMAAGSVEPPPPPPPPPPPTDVAANPDAGLEEGDPNQTMAVGAGAVLLLAAAALFISIRKKRSRRHIDFNTSTQTQID